MTERQKPLPECTCGLRDTLQEDVAKMREINAFIARGLHRKGVSSNEILRRINAANQLLFEDGTVWQETVEALIREAEEAEEPSA